MRIEKIPIEKLNPAKYNPRKDLKPGDPEYEKLKRSIEEFGYVEPIVWNERTGNVVGGHQRLKILKELGRTEIEVTVVDLDEIKEKTLNLALNKISGDWDESKLKDLLRDLEAEGADLDATGFEEYEIAEMIKDVGAGDEDDFDLDSEVAKIDQPTTKMGDLWILGSHRLYCGDATNIEDVKKLMGGQEADMVFTDPPYNVNYEGGTKDKLTIKNDNLGDGEFYQLLLSSFLNMFTVTVAGGAIYVCHSDSGGNAFRRAMIDAGWLLKQCLIWVKNGHVIGRQDYHWKHEPILYGWKPGAKHKWYGGRKQSTVIDGETGITIRKTESGTVISFDDGIRSLSIRVSEFEVIGQSDGSDTTVWYFDKPLRNADHPTMKPVGIPLRAIKNSTKKGEVVLDCFAGSGSTLIAAEKANRKCYAMELDPVYCDVIVQRYINLKGHDGDVYLERDGNKIAFPT